MRPKLQLACSLAGFGINFISFSGPYFPNSRVACSWGQEQFLGDTATSYSPCSMCTGYLHSDSNPGVKLAKLNSGFLWLSCIARRNWVQVDEDKILSNKANQGAMYMSKISDSAVIDVLPNTWSSVFASMDITPYIITESSLNWSLGGNNLIRYRISGDIWWNMDEIVKSWRIFIK